MADVHLMTLREEMAGIAVPGKLYGIMAAGRPVLMVGPEASESGETIQISGAGRVVDPSQDEVAARTLHETLMRLYHDDGLRAELGKNGREAFLEHFEREVCCREWTALLRTRAAQHQKTSESAIPA
jgi:glycosyltransferase involved in cell wall biosynthesis